MPYAGPRLNAAQEARRLRSHVVQSRGPPHLRVEEPESRSLVARGRRSTVEGSMESANVLSTRLLTQIGVLRQARGLAAAMEEVLALLDDELGPAPGD